MDASAPFGFRPVYHPTGQHRATPRTIASGYATSIFKGDPVLLTTAGVLNIGAATVDLLGIFAGVEYTDATGKPTVSNMWLANTVATDVVAWVYEDPETVFEVQGGGSYAQADIGAQADVVIAAGDSQTGLSKCTLAAVELAAAQGQFRIVDVSRLPGNALGDAFTIVHVKIAQHQFYASKVGL